MLQCTVDCQPNKIVTKRLGEIKHLSVKFKTSVRNIADMIPFEHGNNIQQNTAQVGVIS